MRHPEGRPWIAEELSERLVAAFRTVFGVADVDGQPTAGIALFSPRKGRVHPLPDRQADARR
jgi:hypothetical protein